MSQPTAGLVNELDTCRDVCAHPNHERPMPSVSPIGLMNKPKLSEPIAILTAPDIAITNTMTQP